MTELALTRGDYFSFDCTVDDIPEGQGLVGARFAAKRRIDDEPILALDSDGDYVTIEGNVVTVLLRGAETQGFGFDERRLIWDLEVQLTDSEPYTVDSGVLLVSFDVVT